MGLDEGVMRELKIGFTKIIQFVDSVGKMAELRQAMRELGYINVKEMVIVTMAQSALLGQFEVNVHDEKGDLDQYDQYVSFVFKPEQTVGDCEHFHISFGIRDGRVELIDYACENSTNK
jgi:hypothetical protein